MFMKMSIVYGVVGSVLWYAAQAVGFGFATSLFISLLVPPVVHVAYIVYMNRGGGDW